MSLRSARSNIKKPSSLCASDRRRMDCYGGLRTCGSHRSVVERWKIAVEMLITMTVAKLLTPSKRVCPEILLFLWGNSNPRIDVTEINCWNGNCAFHHKWSHCCNSSFASAFLDILKPFFKISGRLCLIDRVRISSIVKSAKDVKRLLFFSLQAVIDKTVSESVSGFFPLKSDFSS